MTPAVLLVCVAVVTNVNHGTLVNKDCQYAQVNPAGMPVFEVPHVAVNTTEGPLVGAAALAMAQVQPHFAPLKAKFRKQPRQLAKLQKKAKAIVIPASEDMTAKIPGNRDRAFRLSWFRRLSGLAKETD